MTNSSRKRSLQQRIRDQLRAGHVAAIATLDRDNGEPYCALTVYATDHDGTPILLLTGLSDHLKNLDQDNRASLLIDAARDLDHPMTGARLSVQGRIVASDDARHRARYLARHPAAAEYADFGDFGIYLLQIERVHYVGGFGVAKWYDQNDIRYDNKHAQELLAAESGIIAHMNADHGDAINRYAQKLLGLTGSGWGMTGIDPEGTDLRNGSEVARLTFESPISTAGDAREELIRLSQQAKES
jgi:putative heme iron utilization protein